MCLARQGDDVAGGATAMAAREILPTNVKPLHYDLTLEPDFSNFTYRGTVIIEYVKKCFPGKTHKKEKEKGHHHEGFLLIAI